MEVMATNLAEIIPSAASNRWRWESTCREIRNKRKYGIFSAGMVGKNLYEAI
jgi:hypothetical protein